MFVTAQSFPAHTLRNQHSLRDLLLLLVGNHCWVKKLNNPYCRYHSDTSVLRMRLLWCDCECGALQRNKVISSHNTFLVIGTSLLAVIRLSTRIISFRHYAAWPFR